MTADVRTTQRAYPAYKDSGVEWLGEIPEHWNTGLVKRYYSVELGKMLNRSLSTEDGVSKPYLRAANIHWGQLLLSDVNEMEFTSAQLSRYRLKYGDLLVTEGGVTVGRSAIWRDELEECYYQNSINRVRPHSSDEAMTEYLYYWMYFTTTNGFVELTANTATFGHLTQEKLQSFPCVLPPLPEQEAIARFLDHKTAQIDALIAKKEALLARLADKRTALISQAVTKGLDPTVPLRDSGIEWLGQIPAHWSMERLGWITEAIQDIDHKMPVGIDDGIPFLSAKDLLDDGSLNFTKDVKLISEEDYHYLSRKIVPRRDDIVYSRIGARLGKARLVETDIRFLVSYSCCIIRPQNQCVHPSYLCHLLDSEIVLAEAKLRTVGIGVPDLGLGEIAHFSIPLPPKDEQRSISDYLNQELGKIRASKEKIQSAIDKLKQYRTALITNAVTGKIDVREAGSWATEAPVSS